MADIGDRPQTVVSGGRLIITRHGPEEVNKGQEYEYTIDVLNATGRRVENVEVTERIPGELQYVGADPDPDATGPPMRWTLGEMADGAEKTLKVRVRARETGTFKSCAMADHRTPECRMVKVVEPALDPKDKATWRVKIKAVNPGDIRLKVQMTSAMLKRPVEETEATHFYK
jgi:uncharacterized repeat protein (TIGR01451 family)